MRFEEGERRRRALQTPILGCRCEECMQKLGRTTKANKPTFTPGKELLKHDMLKCTMGNEMTGLRTRTHTHPANPAYSPIRDLSRLLTQTQNLPASLFVSTARDFVHILLNDPSWFKITETHVSRCLQMTKALVRYATEGPSCILDSPCIAIESL